MDRPERFHYDPRKILQQIISVYLNLTSPKFAKFIAFDEVADILNEDNH